jgi:hypothetical protein
MNAPKAIPYSMQSLVMSDSERARQMQVQVIRDQHAADDAERAGGGVTRVIAITNYTVYDGTNPRGRVIQAGTEFDMPTFDLDGYIGKVVRADQFGRQD